MFGVFPRAIIIQCGCKSLQSFTLAAVRAFSPGQLYYFIQIATMFVTQGRKEEMERASTKMKPGARILRTIA